MGRIFISHAVADKDLVRQFVALLQTAYDLRQGDIFCSSLEGMGIPEGSNFVEFIRDKLADADFVIMFLTPAYYESAFCLSELGAAWVLMSDAFPLVVPPMKFEDLKATLLGVQGGMINDRTVLTNLFERLKKADHTKGTFAWFEGQRDAFLAQLPALLEKVRGRTNVSAKEHGDLKAAYDAMVKNLAESQTKYRELLEQFNAVSALKDKEDVREIVSADSSESDRFDELVAALRKEMWPLHNKVKEVLFKTQDGKPYHPGAWDSDGEWDQINKAIEEGQLTEHDGGVLPDSNFPRIERTQNKLRDLACFIEKCSEEFQAEYREKHDLPLSLAVRGFWKKHFTMI